MLGTQGAAPVAPAQNAVVVESGPVAYEDLGEDEEEDEEEPCFSAMQLMGGNGQYWLKYSSPVTSRTTHNLVITIHLWGHVLSKGCFG